MTINNPPLYLQNDGPSAEQHRQHMAASFGNRPGVIGENDFLVTERQGTPNMSVDVAEGYCLVGGGESTYQGSYLVHNRGVENVTIAPSDLTNDRTDLIVVRVRDSSESGADNTADIFVVEGTPAASPTVNTGGIPDNCHVIGLVSVEASVSSVTNANISSFRFSNDYGNNDNGSAVQPSGVILCNSSRRPLVNVYDGMKIYERDTNLSLIRRDGQWQLQSPLIVDDLNLSDSGSSSTAWFQISDKRNDWTAPCDGRLHVSVYGKTGFNGNDVTTLVGIGDNSGNNPLDINTSEAFSKAGKWGTVSAARSEFFTANSGMGYRLLRLADTTSGDHHYRLHVTAVFWPSGLYEVL